jgi:hypothetical protein
MLAKQREHKDAFQTVNRRKSTAGYLQADWNAGESPSRPFTVGRAKERKK